MLQSKLFYKTKRHAPKDIEATSHKLLYKGDFISQLGAGLYSFLPLGWRVLEKIENIIREEMVEAGGQEMLMPIMHPRAVWEKTGRWNDFGSLFKLEDRHKKEFALAPTHEEVVTAIAKDRISSYRDLPQAVFQIQTKFRNEVRYTGGLLRTREFVMKDLYSFHSNQQDFEKYYQTMIEAYLKIFHRCGLEAKITEASGEGFTDSFTHEFQALTPVGEDLVIYCPQCDFARNNEISREHKKGSACPNCRAELEESRGIELGNIFPLGDKYSKDFNLFFKDKNGNNKPVIMGCYGIGLGRLMAAIAELCCDDKGIVWPKEVAPFGLHLIPKEPDKTQVRKKAEELYQEAQNKNIEVLYDDRADRSLGEKFIESDLLGIPLRVVVSQEALQKNQVELKKREEKGARIINIKELFN